MVFIDKCVNFKVSEFVKRGIFARTFWVGTISWGNCTISARYENKTLIFDYLADKTPRSAGFKIVEQPTNLGIGKRYFFECPYSGKLCTKLFITPDGYIATRWMINKPRYSYQHKGRLDRLLFQYQRYETPPTKKYGKEYYKGKLTRYGQKLETWDDMSVITDCMLALYVNHKWGKVDIEIPK